MSRMTQNGGRDVTLSARTDRTLLRPGTRGRRYLLAPLTAPSAPRRRKRRPPLALALVLDRSGSMGGRKLELARQAAVDTIGRLSSRDRFSLVVYDDSVQLLMPVRKATPAARLEAEALLATLEPGGATDLAGGWQTGCESLLESAPTGLVRCLLLTDGLANHGIVDPREILASGAAMRRRGVSTSTFGVGGDFDEALLGGLAEAAGGHFYFIERPDQIPAFLSGEVDEALDVAARDVRLVLEGPAGLEIRSLNEYPVESGGGATRVLLGALVSEQEVAPVLELRFPGLPEGERARVTVRWEDADGVLDDAPRELSWKVASHADNDAQPRDRVVDRAVAGLYAARARRHAHLFNRGQDFERAAATLRRCAKRIRSYAGDDAELLKTAADLERDAEEFGGRLDALSLKLRYFSSHASLRQRSSAGRALRSAPPVAPVEPIVVLPTSAPLRDLAAEAIDALAAASPGFAPPPRVGASLKIPGRRRLQTLAGAAEAELVDRAQAEAGLRIVLTSRRLESNWFSRWHPEARVTVVSLHAWDRISTLSPVAFVAFEIALHGLRRHPGYEPEQLLHDETRGCLFDQCRSKGDVDAKLRSGVVCPDCRACLGTDRLLLARVDALGGVVRRLAERGAAAAS